MIAIDFSFFSYSCSSTKSFLVLVTPSSVCLQIMVAPFCRVGRITSWDGMKQITVASQYFDYPLTRLVTITIVLSQFFPFSSSCCPFPISSGNVDFTYPFFFLFSSALCPLLPHVFVVSIMLSRSDYDLIHGTTLVPLSCPYQVWRPDIVLFNK